MIISIESEYYIGDEILYETTAIKDRVIVPVFMTSTIASITILCPNENYREYCLLYEIEDGKYLDSSKIKGIYKQSALNIINGNTSSKTIEFESEYYIGDEVLYETTAIKNRIVVPVFMLNKIESINITSVNNGRDISVKYKLEDETILNPQDIKGQMKSQSLNLF